VRYGISDVGWGDCREEKGQENFLKSLGLDSRKLVCCEQVHGSIVTNVLGWEKKIVSGADGLVTQVPGIVLGIFTADCVPVFLWDEEPRAVGLLHAGWRGVVGKIPTGGVEALTKEFGLNPRKIKVWLGPHIRDCCFEVGEEVLDQFPKDAIKKTENKFTLSLEKAVVSQLLSIGILKENVQAASECTFHDQKFFSYRRDKTNKRMLSYITI